MVTSHFNCCRTRVLKISLGSFCWSSSHSSVLLLAVMSVLSAHVSCDRMLLSGSRLENGLGRWVQHCGITNGWPLVATSHKTNRWWIYRHSSALNDCTTAPLPCPYHCVTFSLHLSPSHLSPLWRPDTGGGDCPVKCWVNNKHELNGLSRPYALAHCRPMSVVTVVGKSIISQWKMQPEIDCYKLRR